MLYPLSQSTIPCLRADPVGKALLTLIRAQECVHIHNDGHLELSAPCGRGTLMWSFSTINVLYVWSCYAPLFEVPLD